VNNRLLATHYYTFSETTDVESIDSSPFYIRQYNYVVDVDGGGMQTRTGLGVDTCTYHNP
jgi:hypothetical protein